MLRGLAAVGCGFLLLALILGQSRAAIFGVLAALFVITVMVFPRGGWRNTALAGVCMLVALQAAVLLNIFPLAGDGVSLEDAGLSSRDERTSGQRFDIWGSALGIIGDHPLTGAGIATFRDRAVRNDYPVPNFDYPLNPALTDFSRRSVPHAHNAALQIGADLGLPGMIVFIGWNCTAFYLLWRCWRWGDTDARVIAIGTAGGLLAYWAYGMIDAVPLWDRFSFIYWLMLGMAAAQYQFQST